MIHVTFFLNQTILIKLIVGSKSATTWKAPHVIRLQYFPLSSLVRCWRRNPFLNLPSGGMRCILFWSATHVVRINLWVVGGFVIEGTSVIQWCHSVVTMLPSISQNVFLSFPSVVYTTHRWWPQKCCCLHSIYFHICLPPLMYQLSHHLSWRRFVDSLGGHRGHWPVAARAPGPAGAPSCPAGWPPR